MGNSSLSEKEVSGDDNGAQCFLLTAPLWKEVGTFCCRYDSFHSEATKHDRQPSLRPQAEERHLFVF